MGYRILWFDPGETSGWGMCDDGIKFECGQLGPEPHHLEMYELIKSKYVGRITIFILGSESFEWRFDPGRSGLELVSKEYIGVCELWSQQYGVTLKQQTASIGKVGLPKSFVKRANLVRLGLWIPGRENRHAMDTYGHILQYIIIHKLEGYLDLLKKGWKDDA